MSSDDDGLLLQDGERGLGQLYDRHGRAIFRLAYALLLDPDDARDVVQDTFVVAWRKNGTRSRCSTAPAFPGCLRPPG